MAFNHQHRIIVLWVVFLFGMVFHTQLALMPLLYGQRVAMSGAQGLMPQLDLWLMLGFFILPLASILLVLFKEGKEIAFLHFGLTIFYTVMNLLHLVFDLKVQPVEWSQILLLVFVFANGIFLNKVAFQWWKKLDKDLAEKKCYSKSQAISFE